MSDTTSTALASDGALTLSAEKAKECDLKLLVSDAQIVAGIFNLPTQTFIQVLHPAFATKSDEKKILTRFSDFLTKNPVLWRNFNSVTVAFLSHTVTFVPNNLFEVAFKDDYLKQVEPHNFHKVTIADYLQGNEFTTVFSEDEKLVNAVKEKFPGCRLTHSATFVINKLQKEYAADPVQRVFAYILPDKLQLIVPGKDKPQFYSIFSYNTPEDFIYYILLVYKKLKFDPEKTPLVFLGEILSQSKLFELAVKYVRNVGFGKRQSGINYADELKQQPAHFYYNIYSMV